MTSSDYNSGNKSLTQIKQKARSCAIVYLGFAIKPSLKVYKYLCDKEFPEEICSQVVQELKTEGKINDKIYALSVIKTRQGKNAESAKALFRRLLRLGIPADVINECINDSKIDYDVEREDAINILHLKFLSIEDTIHEMGKDERTKFQAKCYRFLLNRGYSIEIAYIATKELMREDYLTDDKE